MHSALVYHATGIPPECQRLTRKGNPEFIPCLLVDGDELICDWEELADKHPLHHAGAPTDT